MTIVSVQVLLQAGDPGAGGRPAARLQVWQELKRLEGGGGRRGSALRVSVDPGHTHGLEAGSPSGRTAGEPRCAAGEAELPAVLGHPLVELQAQGLK